MSTNRNNEDADYLKFPKDKKYELIIMVFFLIFFFSFFLLESCYISLKITHKMEVSIAFILIGLLHITASNIMSYLYNFRKAISPYDFLPVAISKQLKIIGLILLVIGFVGFLG